MFAVSMHKLAFDGRGYVKEPFDFKWFKTQRDLDRYIKRNKGILLRVAEGPTWEVKVIRT